MLEKNTENSYMQNKYHHKPSCSVWKSMSETGYTQRMSRAFECFYQTGIPDRVTTINKIKQEPDSTVRKNKKLSYVEDMRNEYNQVVLPGDPQSVADIGCGPWGGMFFLKQWPVMYAVEPVWDIYRNKQLSKTIMGLHEITSYAGNFELPQLVDLMWCINALNHGGCLLESLQNMMNNIRDGGVLCFHVHLRTLDKCDSGHPMPVLESELDEFFNQYRIMEKRILPDPLKPNRPKQGRPTYLALIQK